MKTVIAYKEVVRKVPLGYKYTCDSCGHTFKKGERKVTYYLTGEKGEKHACYSKPCSPFSKPKDYEQVWDTEKGKYVWKEIATQPKDKK